MNQPSAIAVAPDAPNLFGIHDQFVCEQRKKPRPALEKGFPKVAPFLTPQPQYHQRS
jgi:hypothetical protein